MESNIIIKKSGLGPLYIEEPHYLIPEKAPATAELVSAYLESRKGSIAEASLRSYGFTLRAFARQFPVLPSEPETIEAYLGQYEFGKSTANSIYLKLKPFSRARCRRAAASSGSKRTVSKNCPWRGVIPSFRRPAASCCVC